MFTAVARLLSFIVGLFAGQLVSAVLALFAISGAVITALALLVLFFAFLLLERLRGAETRLLLRMVRKATRSSVTDEAIDAVITKRNLDPLYMLAGAVAGLVVSLIWSPTFFSDLLPF